MRRAALALLLIAGLHGSSRAQAHTRTQLAEWVSADPANAELWREFASREYSEGRYRESIAAYQRALQLSGGRMRGLPALIAQAYARSGNEKQARRWRELTELETSARVKIGVSRTSSLDSSH